MPDNAPAIIDYATPVPRRKRWPAKIVRGVRRSGAWTFKLILEDPLAGLFVTGVLNVFFLAIVFAFWRQLT